MSADLDDLFTALGRHCDALPPPGVADARRRGAARRRNRALAAAAAVLLVLAGAGVVTWQRRHAEPILPATTPARIRGMAPVGEPLRLPAGSTWTSARISGTHVYGLAGAPDSRVQALDAATGVTTWTAATPPSAAALTVTPRAVLLRGDDGWRFHDPDTGAVLWTPAIGDRWRVLSHTDVALLVDLRSGDLAGHDIVTGRKLWTASGGGHPLQGLNVMRTAADGADFAPYGTGDRDTPFTDDRLILVTEKGDVVIRDIRTGRVRTTVPAARPDVGGVTGYEGIVYTTDRVDGRISIRATDTDAGTSAIVYRRGAAQTFFPCGPRRLCVYEEQQSGMVLLLIDVTDGRILRETPAPRGAGAGAARNGRVATSITVGSDSWTVVLDENGGQLAEAPGAGGFIDDGNVLALVRDPATGRFTARAISGVDGRTIDLGEMPEISGGCDWNADYLTCPTGSELWTWKFER
ncbi:hypothetical protein AMIS_70310 [Actinoplanes missouriensis 431]|uniref:Pyrrolo-quinoline quinone repeat domain-containing protein n=1 Tax=Actinoplanes missouriensis (strain ATCC 14538 / DSM 43046 / CBS 188.64 / JCM 3121 / NBRC 102363 / NCIMB 12654 / NRRL B-3342 / UNCC 431) TaxID=512565 RepID=I0HGW4_ACTM4|nr:PQQ-binding-like beta-propeller repeat protein [Actinoplanes missouriensis]BAL92251.1 hypothetical protein AMIS_70310 [Actinoplanes missouriensis 431]